MRFTDSPIEQMVIHNRGIKGNKEPERKKDGRCGTCPYGTGRPCVSLCMADLVRKKA